METNSTILISSEELQIHNILFFTHSRILNELLKTLTRITNPWLPYPNKQGERNGKNQDGRQSNYPMSVWTYLTRINILCCHEQANMEDFEERT